MGFINYLLLGAIAYGAGWAVRIYVLEKKEGTNYQFGLKHPLVLTYLGLCFAIMLVISALIGRYMLGHNGLDIAYILVNSAAATFVFSFGLIKDHVQHDIPD